MLNSAAAEPGNAHAQVIALLRDMRAMAVARGIHSQRFDDASYAIETITRVYMEPAATVDWGLYDLTVRERQFVDVLFARFGRTVSRDGMLAALYCDRPDGGAQAKMVDVLACHLRPKLIGSPYAVETDRGVGYKMVRREDCKSPYRNRRRYARALYALEELRA